MLVSRLSVTFPSCLGSRTPTRHHMRPQPRCPRTHFCQHSINRSTCFGGVARGDDIIRKTTRHSLFHKHQTRTRGASSRADRTRHCAQHNSACTWAAQTKLQRTRVPMWTLSTTHFDRGQCQGDIHRNRTSEVSPLYPGRRTGASIQP